MAKRRSAEEVAAMIERAEATNRERDALERSAGLAAPPDFPLDLLVRTAISALEAGLRENNWDCVAEATAMLGDRMEFRPWLSEINRESRA
jgi:hypothetical protein